MNSSLLLIIVALVFTALSAGIAVNFWLSTRNRPPGLLPRKPITSGYHILGQQLVTVAVIFAFVWLGGIELADLGASESIHPAYAFIAGVAVYLVILGTIELSAKALGIRERLHDLSFETMRMIWPRNRLQKAAAFAGVCFLNPFSEEVVYRGVLVHHIGEYTGEFALAAIFGFILSLAAHMYQGSWSLPFQALFHGASVALVLSPLGLFACIGLHFAGDLIPVVTMRTNMLEWRDRRRKLRKT